MESNRLAPQQQLSEQHRFFLKDKRVIFGLVALCIGALGLISVYLYQQSTSQQDRESSPVEKKALVPSPVLPTPSVSVLAPNVYFQQYKLTASDVSLSEPITEYALQTQFSDQQILEMGIKLGLSEFPKTNDREVVLYNLTDLSKKGYMVFNRQTGAFQYRSYGSLHSGESQSPQGVTKSIVTELGLFDTTLDCTITYQRKDEPDITYVECHRDWEKLGLPLVDPAGLLHVQETRKLTQLKAGIVDKNAPSDEDIVNVSTGDNGKVRPNDYNTLTVGVRKDGRVVSIDNNLRSLSAIATKEVSELVSPEEALDLFKKEHKSSFSLTAPSGAGSLDWEKVYPRNQAFGKTATITDFALVYLDKPMDVLHDAYKPYYVIRGTSMLSSGYTVRFVQALPAERRDALSLLSETRGFVAGESDNSIQIGTFDPTVSATAHPTRTGKQGSPTISPSEDEGDELSPTRTPTPDPRQYTAQCPAPSGKEVAIVVPGYGTLIAVVPPFDVQNRESQYTFFWKSVTSSVPNPTIEHVRSLFFQAAEEQFVINVAKSLVANSRVSEGFTSPGDVQTWMQGFARSCGAGDRPFPIATCAGMNRSRVAQIVENVAQRIFTAIQQKTIAQLESQKDIFEENVISNLNSVLKHAPNNISRSIQGESRGCYISGVSPVIFVYSDSPQTFSLSVNAPLTYTDPLLQDGKWQAVIQSNTLTVATPFGDVTRDVLYYEYDKKAVSLTPSSGYVVPKAQWKAFVREHIASALLLTQEESDAFVSEIAKAVLELPDKPYIVLQFVSPDEVNKKLPLLIDPQPSHITRIHVGVSAVDFPLILPAPDLAPVSREGFTLVELGAFALE